MSEAHRRPKTPDQTRRALLDAAAAQALAYGLTALSLPAVAEAAGLTKGALFHHFGSKQGLIDALCDEILTRIDSEIDTALAHDAGGYGTFTRAYLHCVFAGGDLGSPWSALSLSAITDPQLATIWANWLGARLRQHSQTDQAPGLEILRLAADGYWLASCQGIATQDHDALYDRLMAGTHPARET